MDYLAGFLLLVLAASVHSQQQPNPACADLDVVFVVDASGSIQETDPNGWTEVKGFISQIIHQFHIGPEATRVGLTVFSEFAAQAFQGDPNVPANNIGFFNLNQYKTAAELEQAISKLVYFNSLTNTPEGLRVANELILTPSGGDRPDANNLVFVITDGQVNIHKEQLADQAKKLQAKATVVAVGVTSQVLLDELHTIASRPDLVVLATNFQELAKLIAGLITLACGMTTTPVVPPVAGGRCCDFDGNYKGTFCDFQHGGTTRFSLNKRGTPSEGTGPVRAESGHFYAYMEASNLDVNDTAELWWRGINANNTCLTFYYNMRGKHTGYIEVDFKNASDGKWQQFVNGTDDTGPEWKLAVLNLNTYITDLKIVAVRGSGYQGDIAIDTVRLTLSPCYPPEDNNTCTPAKAPAKTPAPAPSNVASAPPQAQHPSYLFVAFPPAPAAEPADDDAQEYEDEEDFQSEECEAQEPFHVVLVGGQNATYGRVEIYYNDTFGTVCNTTFGKNEAEAVCKAAGFFGGRVLYPVPSDITKLQPNENRPVFMDNVRCSSGESLKECCRSQWGVASCDHSADAYVACDKEPSYCKTTEDGPEIDRSLCGKNTPSLNVLLRGGASPNIGRLEVYYRSQFGTICNDSFGILEAMAACKSMGFYGGNVWRNPPSNARLGNTVDRKVLLSGLSCKPGDRLQECSSNAVGNSNQCTHDQDVFIRCYDRPEYCTGTPSGCNVVQVLERPEEPEETCSSGASQTSSQGSNWQIPPSGGYYIPYPNW